MTCRLRWYVEMETICIIPIWRTFGRIQWHVIPQPRVTLQGAATWWIHCHDSRATCHTAGCSHLTTSMLWSCHIAGCKNSIRHIENRFSPYFFLFLMQFRLWRAAAFVSSPIHLCHTEYVDVDYLVLEIYLHLIYLNTAKHLIPWKWLHGVLACFNVFFNSRHPVQHRVLLCIFWRKSLKMQLLCPHLYL